MVESTIRHPEDAMKPPHIEAQWMPPASPINNAAKYAVSDTVFPRTARRAATSDRHQVRGVVVAPC